jgi:mono/diheme cytochrome c family protein
VKALVAALSLGWLAACSVAPTGPGALAMESTYWKVLARAENGDAEAQNAVAFMLYHGEGVGADKPQARFWFERAAAQGNERARRNLAFIASHPQGSPAQAANAATRASAPAGPGRGELGYLKYCGGCHGPNGIAAYENSPSFAFGERLEKADATLMRSVLDGMREMAAWEGKLPLEELRDILAFVRTLPARYDRGVGEPLLSAPGRFYLFGPMEARSRPAPD